MFASQMMGGGMSAAAATGVLGGVANGLTAAGTTQATALALGLQATQFVSTAGASSGVRLPSNMNPGEGMVIFNGGASTMALYPPSGGTLNNVAADGGFDIATLKSVVVQCVNPLKFIVMLGA